MPEDPDRELIDELVDALYAALPYVEDATTDPAYKKGVVAKRVAALRKTITKGETRLNR